MYLLDRNVLLGNPLQFAVLPFPCFDMETICFANSAGDRLCLGVDAWFLHLVELRDRIELASNGIPYVGLVDRLPTSRKANVELQVGYAVEVDVFIFIDPLEGLLLIAGKGATEVFSDGISSFSPTWTPTSNLFSHSLSSFSEL